MCSARAAAIAATSYGLRLRNSGSMAAASFSTWNRRAAGSANKIRTYQLQDSGLDTVDANMVLGFDDDERDYAVAVRMLQALGCTRLRLLTNNPAKLEGLSRAGIDVFGRVPLQGPINSDNRRYLTAKAKRAGHKLDHVLGVLTELGEPGR